MASATFNPHVLRYETRPPLAWITLNRPDFENQVDLPMTQELRRVAELLDETPDVRVVVVTGAGSVFSCGREPLLSIANGASGDAMARCIAERRAASVLASMSLPTIAAINGHALDHGLELALACDLRIACENAQLGVTDVGKGRVPWDGATQRLPRLVGRSRALDMLLTSRVVSADEALEVGLVNAVVKGDDLADAVRQWTEAIASAAPIAGRYAKEAVLHGLDLSLEQGLMLEADLSILLHSTVDRNEGIRSFLSKSFPKFRSE